ncbi:hypothetical protein [Psychromonas sp. Urea-02u-13]|uniref:hypothetical protein n=1 Tax=Psychromonas sp. Urea-02u-13 TaxID=2058326 RepID=UPI000C33CC3D|nr:hypothetical protein [Psychromonas sp. Urea-02u-13]PKG36939.1 hypothetical protein CXF74_21530 [Psychromonas sp. Urea-02u-13]
MEVTSKKISKRSFFMLLLKSIGIGMFITSFIFGVFALFGFETVSMGGTPVTGFPGFILSIIIGLIMSIIFTCIMCVYGLFGLWVYSYFGDIKINFKELVESAEK